MIKTYFGGTHLIEEDDTSGINFACRHAGDARRLPVDDGRIGPALDRQPLR